MPISKTYYAHPSAIIDHGAVIGAGTKIWHFCHIMGGATIGENCSLGQNVFVADAVVLGDGVKVQNNVSIYRGVVCEDEVFLGPSMVFTNVVNPRSAIDRKSDFVETYVSRGSTIGANATIICGCHLGVHAFVGAGAVVTKDIPDFALVIGNPAKQIGWMCKCGQRLNFDANFAYQCADCGAKYIQDGGLVRAENG